MLAAMVNRCGPRGQAAAQTSRVTTRRSSATARLAAGTLVLLAVAACGTDDPEPSPPSTTSEPVITAPSPDPTEAAEAAAIEAVQRFYDTEEQAGTSGDWSEAVWTRAAAGEALADRLSLGVDYTAAGWLFEGEIGVAEPVIDSVQLKPEPRVVVTSCIDRSTWISPDGPGEPALVTNTVTSASGVWLVTETVGEGTPCES